MNEGKHEVRAMPAKAGVIARTFILGPPDGPYEVITTDLRSIKMSKKSSQELINAMIGEHPYETAVYSLVGDQTPISDLEAILAEELGFFNGWRRDLQRGDLYLTRTVNEEAAALEHDSVVQSILKDKLTLMGQVDRMALYGVEHEMGEPRL